MTQRERDTDEAEVIDPNRWMLTFSDLIMLMLTFFVMLLSMSSMDENMLEDILLSLQEAPGLFSYADSREVSDLSKFISSYIDTENKFVIDQDLLKNLLIPLINVEKMKDLMKDAFDFIDLADDQRGIVLSFQEELLFEPGEVTINKTALPILEAIAVTIETSPNDILIMGHTDNISTQTELYASNWELSTYRGLSVLEYFLTERGLTPGRFSVGGYGPSRPRNPNNTPKNRASNRRVEIIFRHW